MKKILIAGGSGFIGYHLSKRCLKKGWKVISISSKRPRGFRKLKKVKCIICDLRKKNKIKHKIKSNFNFIINLSGHVDHKNKKKTFESHFIAVKNLVNFSNKSSLERFVQMGSSAEYGGLSKPQKETSKCLAKSYYGNAKLKASNFLLDQFKKYRLPITIFRLFQAYGPYQDINRLIPITINACMNNRVFNCSDGNQLRDFIYIDDVTEAIIKCLQNKSSIGQIYNLGSGKKIKIKSIIKTISNYYGGGKPLFGKIKLRKDESKVIFANIKKIKKQLNWKPRVNFEEGLKKTLKFYDKNKKD